MTTKRPYQTPNSVSVFLYQLPDGTEFHVCNGDWSGKIIDRDGSKYLCNVLGEHLVTKDLYPNPYEIEIKSPDGFTLLEDDDLLPF